MRLQNLRGDAVFGGHGDALGDLVSLSDQAIRYTRGLTFELSPPVLYELGLGPALDWLGEQTARKHGLKVKVKDKLRTPLSEDIKVMLWKSARELLHNVVKHADAEEGRPSSWRARRRPRGPDGDRRRRAASIPARSPPRGRRDRFGLFSIEERLRQLGGRMTIDTEPGQGTTRAPGGAPIPGGDEA